VFYPSCGSLRPSFYFSVLRLSILLFGHRPFSVRRSYPRLSSVYSCSNLVLPVLLGGLSSSPAIASLSLFSVCRSTSHSLTLPDCLFICQASASLTPFALCPSSIPTPSFLLLGLLCQFRLFILHCLFFPLHQFGLLRPFVLLFIRRLLLLLHLLTLCSFFVVSFHIHLQFFLFIYLVGHDSVWLSFEHSLRCLVDTFGSQVTGCGYARVQKSTVHIAK
jgi:hypothetical protein